MRSKERELAVAQWKKREGCQKGSIFTTPGADLGNPSGLEAWRRSLHHLVSNQLFTSLAGSTRAMRVTQNYRCALDHGGGGSAAGLSALHQRTELADGATALVKVLGWRLNNEDAFPAHEFGDCLFDL